MATPTAISVDEDIQARLPYPHPIPILIPIMLRISRQAHPIPVLIPNYVQFSSSPASPQAAAQLLCAEEEAAAQRELVSQLQEVRIRPGLVT